MQENTSIASPFDNVTSLPDTTERMAFDSSTEDTGRTGGQSWDDATWILTSAFIIFTMQSGFGLLESGCVSTKNEVNIMAKNVADVIFGGISYWMLGYGFSFGDGRGTNGFCGIGKFFIDPDESTMGEEFSRFVFQSSFATTATTIVSGAIAERTRYLAYIIFSFFNTFVFCFPAHWVWSKHGWLNKLGVVDVAGDGPVHLVGGATSLVATLMIKPRARRFTPEDDHQMGSPTGALLGLFILWWGWLAFNCGSTYGISGGKWKMAARAAATTLMSASAGGVMGFAGSYIFHKRKFHISHLINGVLAGLVSITACCAVTGIWESLVIGGVGGILVFLSDHLLVRLHIDDPVSAVPCHGVAGVWGLIGAGLFTHKDTVTHQFAQHSGLAKGGGFYLLGVQALAAVSILAWSFVTAGLLLKILDLTIGLRLTPEEEEIGADFIEHNIRRVVVVKHEIVSPSDVNDNDSQCMNRSFTRQKEEVVSSVIADVARHSSVFHTDESVVLQVQCPQSGETTTIEGNSSDSAPSNAPANIPNNKSSNGTIGSLFRRSFRCGGNKKPTSASKVRKINIRNRNGTPGLSPVRDINGVQLTDFQRRNTVTNGTSSLCMISYSARNSLPAVSSHTHR